MQYLVILDILRSSYLLQVRGDFFLFDSCRRQYQHIYLFTELVYCWKIFGLLHETKLSTYFGIHIASNLNIKMSTLNRTGM